MMGSSSINNNPGGLLRRSAPRNDDVNTRNDNKVTASPKGAAAHSPLKLNQTPENKPGKAKQENNVSKQLSSPGAEPPKDPDRNQIAASRAKQRDSLMETLKVTRAFEKSLREGVGLKPDLLGGKNNPITTRQLLVLMKQGHSKFRKLHFVKGIKLNNMNLEKLDFSHSSLPEANFSNSSLLSCDMPSANLQDANFTGSVINKCNLNSTDLLNSSFKAAQLTDSDFDYAYFVNSDLSNAEISNSSFIEGSFMCSNWQKAKIVGNSKDPIVFLGSNFTGEDFSKASKEFLEKAKFIGCICNHANFENTEIPIKSFFVASNIQAVINNTPSQDLYTRFRNANFTNAKFIGKKNSALVLADLSGAKLEGADLSDVESMRYLTLVGTNLRNMKNCKELIVSRSDLRLSDLRGTNIEAWSFIDDNLAFNTKHEHPSIIIPGTTSNHIFEENALTALNLEGVILSNAMIRSSLAFSNLRNANFGKSSNATNATFDANGDGVCDIRFADFRASNIENAAFVQGHPTFAFGILFDKKSQGLINNIPQIEYFKTLGDFDEPEISYADLSNRDLSGIEVNDIKMVGTDFTNSNLEKACFHKATIVNPKINNCNLEDSSFHETQLPDISFTNSNLRNTSFNKSNLKHSKFDGSDLSNSEFHECQLNNANLLDAANLENTNLTFDQVAFAVGGHRGVEANKERTRKLFIERGCDLGTENLKLKENNDES